MRTLRNASSKHLLKGRNLVRFGAHAVLMCQVAVCRACPMHALSACSRASRLLCRINGRTGTCSPPHPWCVRRQHPFASLGHQPGQQQSQAAQLLSEGSHGGMQR